MFAFAFLLGHFVSDRVTLLPSFKEDPALVTTTPVVDASTVALPRTHTQLVSKRFTTTTLVMDTSTIALLRSKNFTGPGKKKLPKGVRHERVVHIGLMLGIAEYLSTYVCTVSSCYHSKSLRRTATADSLVWTSSKQKQKPWPELTGSRYGWVENVSARKDMHRLPLQHLEGHWYFWESLDFVRHNWAHYIFQYLAKLQDYLELDALSKHGIGLLIPAYHLTPMTREFLQVLQVPYEVADMNQHYVVDDVYATHFSYLFRYGYDPVAKIFKSFTQRVSSQSSLRCKTRNSIYLERDHSKGDAGNRTIKNEDALIDQLKKNGFTVVKTGNLSLSQKVHTMACLDKFVTQGGTNELNLGFASAPPRIAVLLTIMRWRGFEKFFKKIWGSTFKYRVVRFDFKHGVDLDLVKQSLLH